MGSWSTPCVAAVLSIWKILTRLGVARSVVLEICEQYFDLLDLRFGCGFSIFSLAKIINLRSASLKVEPVPKSHSMVLLLEAINR